MKYFWLPFATTALMPAVWVIALSGHSWSAMLFMLTWQALMYRESWNFRR